jgi:hypothetical protein
MWFYISVFTFKFKSWNSFVSNVTACELDNLDSISGKVRGFSLCHHIQIGSAAHPASHPMHSGNSSGE